MTRRVDSGHARDRAVVMNGSPPSGAASSFACGRIKRGAPVRRWLHQSSPLLPLSEGLVHSFQFRCRVFFCVFFLQGFGLLRRFEE